MWGGYLSDFRSAKELFAAKLQKISESSSPYHTKITFDLTERLVENHLCCRLTHLPEVCRYRCKSVKDDLVDGRIIVEFEHIKILIVYLYGHFRILPYPLHKRMEKDLFVRAEFIKQKKYLQRTLIIYSSDSVTNVCSGRRQRLPGTQASGLKIAIFS